MNVLKESKKCWAGFADIVFPRTCLICKTALEQVEKHICINCSLSLPIIHEGATENQEMNSRFWGRIRLYQNFVFLRYDKTGPLKNIFKEIKYHGNTELATFMGKMMASQLNRSKSNSFDLIIPVPLHPKKERKRGFNQSELIAEGLSMELGIELVSERSVIRTKNTQTQTKLDRNERWENVSSIFKVIKPQNIKDKNILMVDDILTTGSTLESLALELQSAGANKLGIAVLAISL